MQELIHSIIPDKIISQQRSLTQLNDLLAYFVTHATFSTLDIHMQRPLPASLQDAFEEVFCKIGGGNCFQINGAMLHVLTRLGYHASLFSSHVHAAEGHIYDLSQDSHMALLIEFDQQKYVVDPGWGNMPLQIIAVNGDVVTGGHNNWRAISSNTSRIAVQLYLKKEKKWQTQFDFDDSKPLQFAEFKPLAEYVNSPHYPLYTFLLIMKSTPTGTHMITNNNWVFTSNNGVDQTLDIINSGGMKSVLHKHFGLQEEYLNSIQLNLFSEPLKNLLHPLWQTNPKQTITVEHLARSLSETLNGGRVLKCEFSPNFSTVFK